LKADRCASYEQSTIEQQTQNESQKWRLAQKRKADRLAKEVRTQPRSAVQKLRSFGEGTRLMIRSFEELIEGVQSQGYLPQDDLELVLCLFGIAPTRENIRQNALAYLVSVTNLGCTPAVSSSVVAERLKPENRPDEFRDLPVDEVFGSDADHNRELLVGQLELEVERLQAVADRLEREVDGPRLRAVLERAAILTEEAARRVTRSHAEARATYHRASSALWPMLEREKEEGPPESAGGDDAANEATGPVSEPVSAGPVSAGRDEASGSQIEPEDPSGAGAQMVDESEGSVEGRPSGPERQNGVFSPTPTVENTPSEAPVEGRGPEGESVHTSRGAQPVPESVAAAPVSACREEAIASQIEPRIRRVLWRKWLTKPRFRSRAGRRVRSDKTAFSAPRRHRKTRPRRGPDRRGKETHRASKPRFGPGPRGPRWCRWRLAAGPTAC